METLSITVLDPNVREMVANAEEKQNRRPFKTYQSKDIQTITKISKMQLIHWTQQDVILPSVDVRGRGKTRTYDYQNLIEALICRELARLSIGIRLSKELLKWLRKTKWFFYFSLDDEGFDLDPVINELEDKVTKWREKAPGIPGQKILSIFDNDPDDEVQKGFLYPAPNKIVDNSVSKEINKIIKETKGPEKTKLRKWLDEIPESNEPIKRKETDVPAIITRTHTIWEYLRLYPTSIFDFYLILSIDKHDHIAVSLYDAKDISENFTIKKTSMIINLKELILEAGEVHEAQH
jgi:hypothetical protein